MQKYDFLFIFIFLKMWAFCSENVDNQEFDIQSALQCPYVYQSVNVITGEYCESQVDIHLGGPHALTLKRCYVPSDPLSQGWRFNHPHFPSELYQDTFKNRKIKYTTDEKSRLIEAASLSLNGDQAYQRITFKYQEGDILKCSAKGSDGREVQYHYLKNEGTRALDPYLLEKVISFDGKECQYHYRDHPKERSKLLVRRDDPGGRYLVNEYYDSFVNDVDGTLVTIEDLNRDMRIGRVKLQKAPVGADNSPVVTSKFIYHPDATEVFDALNHKTIYRYGRHNKLNAIEKYVTQNGTHVLYRKDRFFWDRKDQLRAKILVNGDGHSLICHTFDYDDKGNLSQHTLYGDLTGRCAVPLQVREDGYPVNNGVESFVTTYEYDDRSRLHAHTDSSGKTVRYSYYPSDLPSSILVCCENDKIKSRTFHLYDHEERLIGIIRDDGCTESIDDLSGVTERLITSFFPKESGPGIGQAERIEESYLDLHTGSKVLLRIVEIKYSPFGEIVQQDVKDAEGKTVYSIVYEYDIHGHLVHSVDAEGKTVTNVYDPFGNQTHLEDHARQIVMRYDFANRPIYKEELRKADNLKTAEFYRYDLLGNRIASVDQFGHETHYSYDDFGRLTEVIYPEVETIDGTLVHPNETYAYDFLDRVISATNPNGFSTSTRYNLRGKPVEIQYADGSKELFEYNIDGSLAKAIFKNGTYTVYQRDYLGRPIREQAFTQAGQQIRTTSRIYNAFHLLEERDGEGNGVSYTYDGAGRLSCTRIIEADGIYKTELVYDFLGRLTGHHQWFDVGEKDFNSIIAERDAQGCFKSVRMQESNGEVQKKIEMNKPHSDELSTEYRYDGCLERWETHPTGIITVSTFDPLGRINRVEKRNGFGLTLEKKKILYDPAGNKVKEIHSVILEGKPEKEVIFAWSYGPTNRLESQIEAAGTPLQAVTKYEYTDGNIEKIIKPDGVCLYYAYAPTGKVSRFFSSDSSFDYVYTYDAKGRMVKAENRIDGTINTRTFNSIGKLTQETLANGISLSSTYDLQGRCTRLTLPDASSIAYQYNAAHLISVQRLGVNGEQKYQHRYSSHHIQGYIESVQMIGELGEIKYRYDSNDRCCEIHSPFWSEELAYHSNGSAAKISITDTFGKVESSYGYDDSNRLTNETGVDVNRFAYDSVQNRTNKNQHRYEVNALNQVVSDGENCYRYDVNGNLIEKIEANGDRTLYSYDALNHLRSVIQKDLYKEEYAYDSFHRRMSKTIYQRDLSHHKWKLNKTDRYLYDDDNEIGAVDQEGNLVELRVLGKGFGAEIGASVAVELHGRAYAPIHDHRGSLCCLIDMETKEAVECYRYNAFGEAQVFSKCNGVENPWRFSSKRLDAATGLVYFGKRFYDPALGRWITKDPLGTPEGINRYAYALNQPQTRLDLYGLYSFSEFFDDLFGCFRSVYQFIHRIIDAATPHVSLTHILGPSLSELGESILGPSMFLMAGFYQSNLEAGVNGKGEINDKVRVTLINGILNARKDLKLTLNKISSFHGGVNIHFIFDPTEGWAMDILKAALAKMGFVSPIAHQLADTWRGLIQEMGGVDGGGVIIHYAHSVGAVHTRAALDLLTPEEKKMIKIYTFGSPTMIIDSNAINYVSVRDGVPLLDPIGFIKGLLGQSFNTIVIGSWRGIPIIDHLLDSGTYYAVLEILGQEFLECYL